MSMIDAAQVTREDRPDVVKDALQGIAQKRGTVEIGDYAFVTGLLAEALLEDPRDFETLIVAHTLLSHIHEVPNGGIGQASGIMLMVKSVLDVFRKTHPSQKLQPGSCQHLILSAIDRLHPYATRSRIILEEVKISGWRISEIADELVGYGLTIRIGEGYYRWELTRFGRRVLKDLNEKGELAPDRA